MVELGVDCFGCSLQSETRNAPNNSGHVGASWLLAGSHVGATDAAAHDSGAETVPQLQTQLQVWRPPFLGSYLVQHSLAGGGHLQRAGTRRKTHIIIQPNAHNSKPGVGHQVVCRARAPSYSMMSGKHTQTRA